MEFDLSAFKAFQAEQQPANKQTGKTILCCNQRTGGFVFVKLSSEPAPQIGDLVVVQGSGDYLRVETFYGQPMVGVIVPAIEWLRSKDSDDSFQ